MGALEADLAAEAVFEQFSPCWVTTQSSQEFFRSILPLETIRNTGVNAVAIETRRNAKTIQYNFKVSFRVQIAVFEPPHVVYRYSR